MNTSKTTTPTRKRTERYAIDSSLLYGLPSHARLAAILRWAGTTGQLREFCRRPTNFSRYFDRSKPGKERLIEAGFYPETTDGCERVENFKSCLAVLRRILGLWNRSMYSNTSARAASSVGYLMR